MVNLPKPATEPTMYFIGVTTGQSSIMRIFPIWAKALGIQATLKGIDIAIHAPAEDYRAVMEFIRSDPLSMGALVTTHKIDLLNACRDLFDELDPYAQQFGEISSISKRDGRLWGHAKDPISVGLVLDFVLRGVLPRSLRGGYTGSADEIDCHEEHSDEEGKPAPIWKAALRHTLEIFVFIFAFSLVFGLIVEGVGEDVFADALGRMGFFQPVVAALVGLIPNCAASVLLTQLYVEGALRFSSLVAGLCTGAGVGLAVLWRANPSWKQNLFITGLTWAAGAAVGVGIQIVVAIFG